MVRSSGAAASSSSASAAASSIRRIVLGASGAGETILLARLDCARGLLGPPSSSSRAPLAMDPPAAAFPRRSSRLPRFSVADVSARIYPTNLSLFRRHVIRLIRLSLVPARRVVIANESSADVSVTKAAAISSAMLARKGSYQKGRESLGLLADMLTDEQAEAVDTSEFHSFPSHSLCMYNCVYSLQCG